jgi:hypothetical protein
MNAIGIVGTAAVNASCSESPGISAHEDVGGSFGPCKAQQVINPQEFDIHEINPAGGGMTRF